MKGLADLEHHVVGNVDDVVDGTHPGRDQPDLHPRRRIPDANPREERRREPRARLLVLDPHVQTLRRFVPEPLERRLTEARRQKRGDLARDTHNAETVGPVGLHIERQDRFPDNLAEQSSDRQLGVEDADAVVVLAEA